MQEPRYAWVVVWAAFSCLALIFGVAYSFAAFFESFSHEFAALRADVSLVFALSGGVYFVLGAVGGMLADRYGARRVCCAGMVLIAAGLLTSSFAASLSTIYAAYGVGVGLGIALVYTPAIGCVPPWFTLRRGFAAGIASAGIGAGTVLVPLLAAQAITSLDWRNALRAMSAGVLVIGIGAAWLLRRAPSPASPAGAAATQAAGLSLGETLRTRRFWWLYLGVLCAAPTMFIPFAHVSAAARDLGVTPARSVGLVGMIGIGSLVGRFAIGALADRLGRLRSLALLQASMALSYLLWWGAGGYVALALFALWFGLSYGGIVSLLPALCMDLFGARAVSSVIGTLYTGAALGNLFGPVVAGAVFDARGSYVSVWIGCLVLSAVATAAAAHLARTDVQRF
jgi:MFS family permease